MIGNVPELVDAVRTEVVMGEVATTVTEFLAARHLLYMLQCN
jgi:hypothetical protein